MIPDRKRLPESALDITLPDRRAKRCTPPRAGKPPKATAYSSSQSDREKWMRDRQEKKRRDEAAQKEQVRRANLQPSKPGMRQYLKELEETRRIAPIEAKREAELLAEAEAEIRHRRLTEKEMNANQEDDHHHTNLPGV